MAYRYADPELSPVANAVYTRWAARILVRKAKSLGFGLPPAMFTAWEIRAVPHIGVPYFFRERFVDVSAEAYVPLVSGNKTSSPRLPIDYRSRFAYLWDEEVLRQRAAESSLLSKLTGLQTEDRHESESRVLTIEDRLKELAKAIDLTHAITSACK